MESWSEKLNLCVKGREVNHPFRVDPFPSEQIIPERPGESLSLGSKVLVDA